MTVCSYTARPKTLTAFLAKTDNVTDAEEAATAKVRISNPPHSTD